MAATAQADTATDPSALAYNTTQAARMVALSERTIRNMVSRGEIPHSRIGGRIVITRRALQTLLDEREKRGQGERERAQTGIEANREDDLAGEDPDPEG